MRRFFRALGVLLLLVVVGGAGFAYFFVWTYPLKFNWLLDRQAVSYVISHPEAITQLGVIDGTAIDYHSGKLDPYSLDERASTFARVRAYEAEIKGWDRAKLSPQEQLSYDIVLWTYDRALADEKYPWLGAGNNLYPINPAFGIQKDLPNFLLSTHSIKNALLARQYVDRLRAMGPVLDAVTDDVERQAKLGVIAPDFVIDDCIDQMKTLIAPLPEKNALVTNLADKTAKLGMDPNERNKLLADAAGALKEVVYPAYQRMIAEEQALRPRATHDAGLWRLNGGSEYYADQLKLLTSTDMTPDEIHAYGLSEVARISAEADTELKSIGMSEGTVGERLDKLMADPRFLYHQQRRRPRADAGALQAAPRSRAGPAAEIFRATAEGQARRAARAGLLREGIGRRLLRAAFARRRAARRVLRQSAQCRRDADVGDADAGLS